MTAENRSLLQRLYDSARVSAGASRRHDGDVGEMFSAMAGIFEDSARELERLYARDCQPTSVSSKERLTKRYVYDGYLHVEPSRHGWHEVVYMAAEVDALLASPVETSDELERLRADNARLMHHVRSSPKLSNEYVTG